jgi:elongation factor P
VKTVNLRTGTSLDMAFQSGDRINDVRLDFHNVQYLYNDGQYFHFMDLETYEQPAISAELLGETVNYLKDGLEVKLTFYQGEPLDIELPTTVDLEVTEAQVALKGDTATGVNKKVMTQTGLEVQVPNFIEAGNIIRVNTTNGNYVTRV